MSDAEPLVALDSAPSGSPADTVRLERRISSAQAARRDRIRDAARDLASKGGYSAVTMHDVATRAGVGRATVYRYYSSKDHLIADVHLNQSAELAADLRDQPPEGETPAERLASAFSLIIEVANADLNLTEAGTRLAFSDDPAVASAQVWQSHMMMPYVDAALGDAAGVDRDAVAEVMQAVLLSVLVGLSQGRQSADEAKAMVSRTAHLLLGN